jgi:hypothetical protein
MSNSTIAERARRAADYVNHIANAAATSLRHKDKKMALDWPLNVAARIESDTEPLFEWLEQRRGSDVAFRFLSLRKLFLRESIRCTEPRHGDADVLLTLYNVAKEFADSLRRWAKEVEDEDYTRAPILAAPPAGGAAPVGNLCIKGKTVYVRDNPVPLDFTPERTCYALAFLGELLKEPGNWKSSPDIGKATKNEGVRFDRIYKNLPDPIKSEIDSDRRKGYRVRLA